MSRKLLFLELIDFIECHILNDNLIDEIAEFTGYSKRYIYTIFKHYAGMNIGEYIRRRRLTKSAILLKYTQKNIYNISIEMNFSSQQAFCRAFKKQFKISPLQFRKVDGIECKGLLMPLSEEKNDYSYNIVFMESIMLKTSTLKYKENVLNNYCKRSASLKLKHIMKFSTNNTYVSSVIDISGDMRMVVNVNSFIGVESNDFNYCTHAGLYAKFKFKGTWLSYIEYSRNCFLALNENVLPHPVLEKIVITCPDTNNPDCHVSMYVPISSTFIGDIIR
ncbi:AraC family transcriptional regulator [Escherichia coli :H14]